MEDIKKRCISKKNIGQDITGVGYALYVQDNIKENDYYRTTTGEIFKAVASKNGRVYYAFGEHYWVDSIAITNFQEDLIDLIEEGDYVNGYYTRKISNYNNELCVFDLNVMQWIPLTEIDVFYNILTHEQYEANCYEVKED